MRRLRFVLTVVAAAVFLAACGEIREMKEILPVLKEELEERVREEMARDSGNSEFDAYQLLDRGSWEEAENAFRSILRREKSYVSLMGLAKAQIGADDYEAAFETLKMTIESFPEERAAYIYCAELAEQLKQYETAADCFERLSKGEADADYFEEKYQKSLWKLEDKERIYTSFRKLYLENPEKDPYLNNYIRSLSFFDSDEKEQLLLRDVSGKPEEPFVRTLIDALRLANTGDMEGAKERLFDPTLITDETKNSFRNLLYGRTGAMPTEKAMQKELPLPDGLYVNFDQGIWGQKGALIGTMKDGVWEGPCDAFSGSVRQVNSTNTKANAVYEGTETVRELYQMTMREGVPEGPMRAEVEYHWDYPNRPNYSGGFHLEVTEVTLKEGKAEGRTTTDSYYRQQNENEWKKNTGKFIHEFHKGVPQPFTAMTEEGEKQVYELYEGQNGETLDWEEDDCGDRYIWSND